MKITSLLILILLSSPSTGSADNCDRVTTPINTIQGHHGSSQLMDEKVWVKGVVTGDFRGKKALGGYFIQDTDADDSTLSSEGIFIHDNDMNKQLEEGDLIVVQGTVSEKFKVTQLNQVTQSILCQSDVSLPQAVPIKLPLNGMKLESVEGMRVTLSEPYVITDLYQYLKYGELTVSSNMLLSPTALYRPGPKVKKHSQAIKNNQLIIDDGRLTEYAQPFGQGALINQSIHANNPLQVGQTLQTTGIMHFAFGKYKLQPTEPLIIKNQGSSKQSKPKKVAGRLSVATFNVENYFTTIDKGDESCGPLQNFGCRGADSKIEHKRQLNKLVAVINTANASVMGLQELENNDKQSIESLIKALNHSAGENRWSFIDTGVLGEDVIKVGIIYQINQVTPVGTFALLNQAADKNFLENKNRILVAQTFVDNSQNKFNLATAHFKSKSCRDAEGIYLDQKDGQGCYNPTRIQVAKQVTKWLASDPTGQGVKATFLVGDLNSYQQEDPIMALKAGGFSNLAESFLSTINWTTSYRGTVGSLDYIMVNEAAKKLSTGLTQWHINSISVKDFSYDTEALSETLKKPDNLYQNDPFSSSDHDLVMAGFEF